MIYQQFSVSLAVSILFSGFLALTFTPALCATLLKPIPEGHHEKRGFFGAFNRGFARVTERYSLLNSKLVARAGRFMLVYAGLVAMLGYFYLRLPEAFVPAEDLGYMVVDVQLPPGASRVRTDATGEELERFLKSREAVASVFLISGFSFSGQGDNAALAFPTFKDWSERGAEQSAAAEIAALNEHFALPDDGTIMAVSPPPIDGLGNSGGFALRLMDRGGVGREALLQARDTLLGEVQTNPKFLYAMMEGLAEAPQLRLLIDREKARALGVSFETISGTLSAAFGSEVINDFTNAGRQQRVVIQAEQGNRMTPESVLELYVPNAAGNLVPLSAFVSVKWEEDRCNWCATTATRRSASSVTPRPASAPAKPWRKWSAWPRNCRPASATSGPACPIRRRSPPGRPPACSPSPSWWSSCCWWRSTRAGRSRCR